MQKQDSYKLKLAKQQLKARNSKRLAKNVKTKTEEVTEADLKRNKAGKN